LCTSPPAANVVMKATAGLEDIARMRPIVLCVAAICMAVGSAMAPGMLHAQPARQAPPEVAVLAGQHPAEYYRTAAKLFRAGKRDDAVFIFYLGQLRYRVHLAARRAALKPDGDPALFASLSEVVGRPLNEYAFGDIPTLAGIIDAVLVYDAANPDRFTPPSEYPAVTKWIREGLATMKATIIRNRDTIKATRAKNGLENRK